MTDPCGKSWYTVVKRSHFTVCLTFTMFLPRANHVITVWGFNWWKRFLLIVWVSDFASQKITIIFTIRKIDLSVRLVFKKTFYSFGWKTYKILWLGLFSELFTLPMAGGQLSRDQICGDPTVDLGSTSDIMWSSSFRLLGHI